MSEITQTTQRLVTLRATAISQAHQAHQTHKEIREPYIPWQPKIHIEEVLSPGTKPDPILDLQSNKKPNQIHGHEHNLIEAAQSHDRPMDKHTTWDITLDRRLARTLPRSALEVTLLAGRGILGPGSSPGRYLIRSPSSEEDPQIVNIIGNVINAAWNHPNHPSKKILYLRLHDGVYCKPHMHDIIANSTNIPAEKHFAFNREQGKTWPRDKDLDLRAEMLPDRGLVTLNAWCTNKDPSLKNHHWGHFVEWVSPSNIFPWPEAPQDTNPMEVPLVVIHEDFVHHPGAIYRTQEDGKLTPSESSDLDDQDPVQQATLSYWLEKRENVVFQLFSMVHRNNAPIRLLYVGSRIDEQAPYLLAMNQGRGIRKPSGEPFNHHESDKIASLPAPFIHTDVPLIVDSLRYHHLVSDRNFLGPEIQLRALPVPFPEPALQAHDQFVQAFRDITEEAHRVHNDAYPMDESKTPEKVRANKNRVQVIEALRDWSLTGFRGALAGPMVIHDIHKRTQEWHDQDPDNVMTVHIHLPVMDDLMRNSLRDEDEPFSKKKLTQETNALTGDPSINPETCSIIDYGQNLMTDITDLNETDLEGNPVVNPETGESTSPHLLSAFVRNVLAKLGHLDPKRMFHNLEFQIYRDFQNRKNRKNKTKTLVVPDEILRNPERGTLHIRLHSPMLGIGALAENMDREPSNEKHVHYILPMPHNASMRDTDAHEHAHVLNVWDQMTKSIQQNYHHPQEIVVPVLDGLMADKISLAAIYQRLKEQALYEVEINNRTAREVTHTDFPEENPRSQRSYLHALMAYDMNDMKNKNPINLALDLQPASQQESILQQGDELLARERTTLLPRAEPDHLACIQTLGRKPATIYDKIRATPDSWIYLLDLPGKNALTGERNHIVHPIVSRSQSREQERETLIRSQIHQRCNPNRDNRDQEGNIQTLEATIAKYLRAQSAWDHKPIRPHEEHFYNQENQPRENSHKYPRSPRNANMPTLRQHHTSWFGELPPSTHQELQESPSHRLEVYFETGKTLPVPEEPNLLHNDAHNAYDMLANLQELTSKNNRAPWPYHVSKETPRRLIVPLYPAKNMFLLAHPDRLEIRQIAPKELKQDYKKLPSMNNTNSPLVRELFQDLTQTGPYLLRGASTRLTEDDPAPGILLTGDLLPFANGNAFPVALPYNYDPVRINTTEGPVTGVLLTITELVHFFQNAPRAQLTDEPNPDRETQQNLIFPENP